ncbi:titin-like [Mercenaria mercenaria]|uniref:titin-like n=1 Tax=Mercenaria mercenaria TaxID=6596 RepID=UPI00234F7EA7|nr:titin-like [Mercenaria mercenaria]
MATTDENITRGHELYMRHISLLGKAVPLALKAVIRKIEAKHGKSLDSVLTERRNTIKSFYYDLFQALFKEDDQSVNTQIESLGLSNLCGVISFVLSESSKLDCVSCISDQLRDVEKYTHSASLEYHTYKQKWESLRESLLELVKESEAEYECKQLIHSYDESEAIKVSKEVIKKLKKTESVDRHIRVAISSEFALDGQSETEDDLSREKGGKVEYNDIEESTINFILPLSDIVVHEEESVVFSCELNTAKSQTEWRKNDEPLLETKTVKILADKGYHWLVFARAMPEDTGKYSCICKNASTSAFVKVSSM